MRWVSVSGKGTYVARFGPLADKGLINGGEDRCVVIDVQHTDIYRNLACLFIDLIIVYRERKRENAV